MTTTGKKTEIEYGTCEEIVRCDFCFHKKHSANCRKNFTMITKVKSENKPAKYLLGIVKKKDIKKKQPECNFIIRQLPR